MLFTTRVKLHRWQPVSKNTICKGGHKDVAIYILDLTDLGYELKVENGTWAQTYDELISLIIPSGTVHAVIDGDKANATLTQDFHNRCV